LELALSVALLGTKFILAERAMLTIKDGTHSNPTIKKGKRTC
jgi:hypothetical protein